MCKTALLLMQAFSTMAKYSQQDLGKYAYEIVPPLSSKLYFNHHPAFLKQLVVGIIRKLIT